MFLTNEELFALSGYKNSARQHKWLRENGIKFLVGYDGRARIMTSHLEDVMGTKSVNKEKKSKPNAQALRAHMGIM